MAAQTRPSTRDVQADVVVLRNNGAQLRQILEIQEAEWDDEARILLDGGPIDKKSPGQRSSALLPLIALSERTPLIIDQPEDNLDNAFIVETVIKAIRARPASTGQIICATHNPNIPVLADAKTVAFMDSDGRRGFLRHAAPLTDQRSVDAITSVMEGGREAFELRAKFYDTAGNA